MSNLGYFNVTWTFNGDVAATGKVNLAQLDTQLGNLGVAQNQTKAALDRITDGQNLLAPQSVGIAQLKSEVPLNLSGLTFLQAVSAVATSNQALSGLPTIDGYSVLTNDRILLTGQTNAIENGIWNAGVGAWSRAVDLATSSTFTNLQAAWVQNGLTYASSIWRISTTTGTVGSSIMAWLPLYLSPTKQGNQTITGSLTVNPPSGAPFVTQIASANAFGVDSAGNTVIYRGLVDLSYTYQTPTSGGSATIPSNVTSYTMDPASLLATYTLTMPASPMDGQIVMISAGSFGITALTLSPNAGQTFATGAAITTLAPSGFAHYRFRAQGLNRWFRIG